MTTKITGLKYTKFEINFGVKNQSIQLTFPQLDIFLKDKCELCFQGICGTIRKHLKKSRKEKQMKF